MFDNVEDKTPKIPIQKKVGDAILHKKNGGRPRLPGKGKYHIKMPITLRKEMEIEARKTGLTYSSFICQAVNEKLERSKN